MSGSYKNMNADSEMMYDDSAFKIFAVAFLAVYWVPAAIYRIYSYISRRLHKKTPIERAREAWCGCLGCHEKADMITSKTAGLKGFTMSDIIFFIVSILLIISSISVIRANIQSEAPFDPFLILQVSKSATPKEIKKAFRRLSILHHPDKNLDDRDGAADRFLKITKAYSALTDEAAKENYKKYGNPDGYTGTSWVIGLPEWVGKSSQSVLLLYALFLVVIFPAMVGFWWHKSKQQLTTEIMTSTFMMYRDTLAHTKRFRDLLTAFCGSDEFSSLYTSDNEDALKELNDSLRRIGGLPKSKSVFEPSLSQVQNNMVMSAYLARIRIPKKLESVLNEILMRAEPLLTSLTDTVGVFQRPDCRAAWPNTFMHGHTTFLARCLHLTQCVYQALDEKSSPLLQIPHFTEREVRFCTSRNGTTKTVYDIIRMDVMEMKRVLREFSDEQLLDVKAFCDRFPVATMQVEPPRVEGEEDSSVHEGDTVTVRATLRILRRAGSVYSPCVRRLPYRKDEVWWVWLADQDRQCPIEVRRLLPRMAHGHGDGTKRRGCCGDDDDDDDDSVVIGNDENAIAERQRRKRREEEIAHLAADPRVTVFDVVFKFMAPVAGLYSLEVKAACDCYAGASKSHLMSMNVKEAVKLPEPEQYSDEEDDDDDEEDEDEDEEDSDEEDEDDEDNEGRNGGQRRNRNRNNEDVDDDDDDDDSTEYEYIEVTASESEGGDLEDEDDDDFGISGGGSKGDPSAH